MNISRRESPVGIVQIVHGIAEHIARYDAFAAFLAEHGYIVVLHDQLGHGKSAPDEAHLGFFQRGKRLGKGGAGYPLAARQDGGEVPRKAVFHFRSQHGLVPDADVPHPLPHGLDGAVISGTGHQSPALVSAGKVMSAIDIRRNGPMHKSDFLNKMAFGTYNDKFENPRTSSDWLSRDEAAVDLYNEDPLCGFVPTAGLLHDMMNGIAFVIQPKNIARMKKDLPILFVSGDCDPVGEQGRGVIRAYKCFLKAGMKDVTMKLYHGGRHEMLNETNRAEVYEDVLSWLNSKTGK